MKKTVGILGVGASGRAIARACKTFGMTVHGFMRTPRETDGIDRVFALDALVDAVHDLDFLVITIPHTEETDKLIGAEMLAAMKPSAILVNIARGGVVDEPALIDALREGTIAAAGLDVFATEPLPAKSPIWELDNVFITPHQAGWSDLYVEQALTVVEPNLRAYLADEPLRNVVSR